MIDMTDRKLDEYVETFRDTHPELFKDKAVYAAFASAVSEMGEAMANNMRLIITNKICIGLNVMALHDLKLLAQDGLQDVELIALKTNPAEYVRLLLTGTWNVAQDIVEMVGYEGANIKDFIKEYGPEMEEDIVFTGTGRGQA